LNIDASPTEVLVRAVHVSATEEERRILVGCQAGTVRRRRPVLLLVGGIEHQLGVIEFEQSPIEIVSRARLIHHGEAEHVAIERD
jgi:hypothetical protein